MGIAAIGIVISHTNFINPSFFPSFLIFIRGLGYFGVDIFFFLSGMGLISGWVNKKYTIITFYKRRLLRILPSYWVVLGGGLLCKILLGQDYNVGEFVASLFCVGFLLDLGTTFNLWFPDCIILCYLAFPFIAPIFTRSNNYFEFSVFGIAISLLLSIIIGIGDHYSHLQTFIPRIPSFLIGIYVGYCIIKKDYRYLDMLTKKAHGILFGIGLIILYFTAFLVRVLHDPNISWKWGLKYWPCIIMSLPFCFLSANFFYQFRSVTVIDYMVRFFNILGKSSWEIYIVHEVILNLTETFFKNNSGILPMAAQHSVMLIALYAAIPLAIFLNKVIPNQNRRMGVKSY